MADLATQTLQAQITALLGDWERERAERRDLRDAMFLDGNRAYQEGFADALDRCIHTLKVVQALNAPES
jgi:hypothetical protein